MYIKAKLGHSSFYGINVTKLMSYGIYDIYIMFFYILKYFC